MNSERRRRPWPCTHPRSVSKARNRNPRLRSSTPTAQEVHRLPLLPSGPDGVHESPLRRTQPSTPRSRTDHLETDDLRWEFNPALADCGFRAPLPPRLARPRTLLTTDDRRPTTAETDDGRTLLSFSVIGRRNTVNGSCGGEAGIRTRGGCYPHTLSRRAPSTTRSPLRTCRPMSNVRSRMSIG